MKMIKIKTAFALNKEERTAIRKAVKMVRSGELDLAEKTLTDISAIVIADKFINSLNPCERDLDIITDFIIVGKILNSNSIDLMPDIIWDQMINKYKRYRDEPVADLLVNKLLVNVDHVYPELKGNISKCNVYYNKDKVNSFDESVESFLTKIFSKLNKRKVRFKLTVKWDGTSGVMNLSDDKIISMLTRGEDGKGADITHLSSNVSFKNHEGKEGLQVEIVVGNKNKEKYEKDRGKKYANRRATAVSILTSSDAYKYAKYLTFMPLNSTNINPDDIVTLNKTFSNNGSNHIGEIIEAYSVEDAMEQIIEFCEKMSKRREEFEFATDGVVIECCDKDDREKLGRTGNVNNFQIAYKFPPLEAITKIKDVTVTVGRTGLITPMAIYEPVMFNGAKQTNTSLSSLRRFEELSLRKDEEILLTYNNDVMAYVRKLDNEYNRNLKTEKLKMPDTCICGHKLHREGANLFCTNELCSGKLVAEWVWFYKTLGVRDVAEAIVEEFKNEGIIKDYKDLLFLDYKKILKLDGYKEKTVNNIKKQINFVLNNPIDEAKLIAALGISGEKTAKLILSTITVGELLEAPHVLMDLDISTVGEKKKKTFLNKLLSNKNKVLYFMKHLCVNKVKVSNSEVKVCFTGFRDENIKTLLEGLGVEVQDSTTKKTTYVVVKDINNIPVTSSTKKADKYGIRIIGLGELLDIMKSIE